MRLPGRRTSRGDGAQLARGRTRSRTTERAPGLDPGVLVLAGRRVVLVGAVGLRRGPVPDLVPIRLVTRMLRSAVAREDRLGCLAGLLRDGSLTEPDGRFGVRLRGEDVVHPAVHAVRMRRVLV